MKAFLNQVEQSLRDLGYGSSLSASLVNTNREFITAAQERGREAHEVAKTLHTNREKIMSR
jgi:uncharacterized membrane protein